MKKELKNGSIFEYRGEKYQVLIDRYTLKKSIKKIARRIKKDYQNFDEPPLLLTVTTGGTYLGVLLSLELGQLGLEHLHKTVTISRYGGNNQTKKISISKLPEKVMKKRRTIVVEDLVDEGITLNNLFHKLKSIDLKSIEFCVLTIKKTHKPLDFQVKYCMFPEVEDDWLVGFGLDDNELGRWRSEICKKII